MGLVCLLCSAAATAPAAGASARPTDPASIVPMGMLTPEHRALVTEVIRDHQFHRKGKSDVFPCDARLYLQLLNDPALTLGLWRDLADTPAKLKTVAANRYEGTDGSGTSGVWEFLYRSPRLHILACHLNYNGALNKIHLQGRIVLAVRTDYFKDPKKRDWIRHEVEVFVKIDSKGWKALARAARPILEKLLEDQVDEAGWFVSLMGRLVETYPSWACKAASNQKDVSDETKNQFLKLVAQNRKGDAREGRPAVQALPPTTNADSSLPPYVSSLLSR